MLFWNGILTTTYNATLCNTAWEVLGSGTGISIWKRILMPGLVPGASHGRRNGGYVRLFVLSVGNALCIIANQNFQTRNLFDAIMQCACARWQTKSVTGKNFEGWHWGGDWNVRRSFCYLKQSRCRCFKKVFSEMKQTVVAQALEILGLKAVLCRWMR